MLSATGFMVMAILLLPSLGPARAASGRLGPLVGAIPTATSLNSSLSGTWTPFAPSSGQPFGRADAAVAFDPVEGLGVLFGGRAANGTVLNDTWVNDGDYPGKWGAAPYAAHVAPPPLLDAALTFDGILNEFLLFGGRLADGAPYNGTWVFGNFAWTNLTGHLALAPPVDPDPTMAFDATEGQVVLVSSSDPGATWTFGPGGWTGLRSTEQLPPIANATAVADPLTEGVLLFGGQTHGPDPVALNETWMFQSGGWQRASGTAAPPAETRPSMAYDPRIPGVLLYSSATTVATWTYTSTGWAQWPGGPLPTARTDAQLYYDSDASYDSLFGGVAANGSVDADNWGWSVPPTVLTPTLGAAAIGLDTWVEVGAVIAVPIVVALLLRRRPPRAKPTDAPAAAASTAPS